VEPVNGDMKGTRIENQLPELHELHEFNKMQLKICRPQYYW